MSHRHTGLISNFVYLLFSLFLVMTDFIVCVRLLSMQLFKLLCHKIILKTCKTLNEITIKNKMHLLERYVN